MFKSFALTPINRILRGESWACRRLQSYSGKTLCIQVFPLFELNLIILESGELQKTSKQNEIDTTISISPGILPGLLAHDECAYASIEKDGDIKFAEDLIDICKNINLNVEQDLSKIIGDIPAHRLTQAGEHTIQWHANSIHNLSEALIEYWLEEQPMLTKSTHINNYIQKVKKIKDDVDQLDKRIQHLNQKVSL
ncbi:MAG: hypothetical protein OEX11_05200 [Nitrosomonas sp.]|nr:hypothetical protein [Nitrosomonas sp.]